MSTILQEPTGTLDPIDCWSVIERVAATPSLKRAARLREFLLYVATKSLKEGRSNIHEQEIGETVFGRARAYDTSQDNIVRVSATELRKRVDAYFATEGNTEPIIFEIPRGTYMPAFRMRENIIAQPAVVASALDPALETVTVVEQRPQARLAVWIVSAIAVLLAIACILLWRQNAALRQSIQILEHQHSMFEPGAADVSRFKRPDLCA